MVFICCLCDCCLEAVKGGRRRAGFCVPVRCLPLFFKKGDRQEKRGRSKKFQNKPSSEFWLTENVFNNILFE